MRFITSRKCIYLDAIVRAAQWMVAEMQQLNCHKTNRSRSPDVNQRLRLWEKVMFDREQRNAASLARGTLPSPYRSQSWPTYQHIHLVLTFRGERYLRRLYGTHMTRIKVPGARTLRLRTITDNCEYLLEKTTCPDFSFYSNKIIPCAISRP